MFKPNPIKSYVFKQHEWNLIEGGSASRFGSRVWKGGDGVNPIFTTYNGREVMVYKGYTYKKGEFRGSYTVTPDQIKNRPPATVTKGKVKFVYFTHDEEA